MLHIYAQGILTWKSQKENATLNAIGQFTRMGSIILNYRLIGYFSSK